MSEETSERKEANRLTRAEVWQVMKQIEDDWREIEAEKMTEAQIVAHLRARLPALSVPQHIKGILNDMGKELPRAIGGRVLDVDPGVIADLQKADESLLESLAMQSRQITTACDQSQGALKAVVNQTAAIQKVESDLKEIAVRLDRHITDTKAQIVDLRDQILRLRPAAPPSSPPKVPLSGGVSRT